MASPALERALARLAGQVIPATEQPQTDGKTETWSCACAFAADLGETDPCAFPRVGFYDNVLYRGGYIIEHRATKRQAYEPLVKDCCRRYFQQKG